MNITQPSKIKWLQTQLIKERIQTWKQTQELCLSINFLPRLTTKKEFWYQILLSWLVLAFLFSTTLNCISAILCVAKLLFYDASFGSKQEEDMWQTRHVWLCFRMGGCGLGGSPEDEDETLVAEESSEAVLCSPSPLRGRLCVEHL